jgi:hypothetical protein
MNGAKHLHAPNSENQKYVDSVDDFIRMLTQTSTMRVQKYFTRTISLDRSGSINYISKFAKIFNFLLNCALSVRLVFSQRAAAYKGLALLAQQKSEYYLRTQNISPYNMVNMTTFNPFAVDSEKLYNTYFHAIVYMFYYIKERRIDSDIDYTDTEITNDLLAELEKDYKKVRRHILKTINLIVGKRA